MTLYSKNNETKSKDFFSESRITATSPRALTNWLFALRISFYSLLSLFTFNLPTVPKYTACPAVLVETAFIDNPVDANLLVEREDDFVRAIGDIGKHFTISEFVCHCYGKCAEKIAPRLIEVLEQFREKVDGDNSFMLTFATAGKALISRRGIKKPVTKFS